LIDGHLIESVGRAIHAIIDIARYSIYEYCLVKVSSSAERLLMANGPNLYPLRKSNMSDLFLMNNAVYTYWDQLGSVEMGVVEYIKKTAEINGQNWEDDLYKSVRFWKSSRVYGDFYILLGAYIIGYLLDNIVVARHCCFLLFLFHVNFLVCIRREGRWDHSCELRF
jgi:hypothetical protein